jgi:hypothetical protein
LRTGERHFADDLTVDRDDVDGLQRPRLPDHPGGAPRRRHLGGDRAEGVDEPRPVRGPLRPARPHRTRSRRVLLARTAPGHGGSTAFFADMDTPGITCSGLGEAAHASVLADVAGAATLPMLRAEGAAPRLVQL